MPHTYTNGIVTFYEDSGDGPAVVLIHGHSGDLRMWECQVPALVGARFRAVRYDVRGHGRSLIPPDGYTWENYSADLADLLDRLNVERPITEALDVPAAHLLGLSMGGGIALQFALDHPERVLSLTLVDSALPGFAYSEDFAASVQQVQTAVRERGVRAAIDELWLQHPLFHGVRRFPQRFARVQEIVRGYQGADYRDGATPKGYQQPRLADRLPEITAPALVVAGEEDLEDFRLIARILAENLADALYVEVPGCGHLPPLEVPDRFNEILIGFLRAR